MLKRLLALSLLVLLAAAETPAADLDQARVHFEEGDYEAAVELLSAALQRDASDPAAHELLASSFLKLDEKDAAAHHLETAYDMYVELGEDKVARELKSRLYRTDPYASSRHKLFARITKRVLEASKRLAAEGSAERALALVDGVLPVARGKDRTAIEKLHDELAAAFEEVDLGAAGGEKDESGAWPLCERSSVRYELRCNLEPEVTELIGETMDSIFDYYVSLYFDGDDSKIKNERATIRIYPTKEEMLGAWQGGSAPEGWWSPGSKEVVSFDTRTTWGSLDELLSTLFHEASHQFMTFMSKGGRSPAWLNEGTSSFFEGAVAMADNRVLWPDAAIGRLRSLKFMLEKGGGPTPRQVIEYMDPGSYPGNYYAFGWGYVYYLQQYEDPETLEYVYRPLYAAYRDEVTTKQSNSMEVFERMFLGKKSPRGHKTFEDFEKDWVDWILKEVGPQHLTPGEERRELRLAKIARYVEAADAAQGKKKAKVSESELLTRALGHLEYIRTRIDEEDSPDPELILQQATILERLLFKESAAPLLEQWLDLADAGGFEFEQEVYEDVEKRLKAIDSKNHELRRIRGKIEALIRNAKKLLAKYEKNKFPMPLRSYTFASTIADIFASDESLALEADRLKKAAREAGVLKGSVLALTTAEKDWKDLYERKPKRFSVTEDSVAMTSLADCARINTAVEISGEYELRADLTRVEDILKISRGTRHGLVIAGTPGGDWLLAGLRSDNKLKVWQLIHEGGGTTPGPSEEFDLSVPPPAEGPIPITVHVHDKTKFTVTVGEADPIELDVETSIPAKRFAGAFVKDGGLLLSDFVVELFL